MPAKSVSTWLAWLLAAIALLCAPATQARPAGPSGGEYGVQYVRCFADGTPGEALDSVTASARWTCGEATHPIAPARVYVRFDLRPGTEQPRYFETRRAAVSAIDVLVVDTVGGMHRERFAPSELQASRRGGYMRVPLPVASKPARAVIVAFDMPTHRMALEQAQLVPSRAHDLLAGRRLLLILAGLCGMLLMPLIFNAAFYRILREPFVVWHSALALSLLLTILVSSGLSFYAGHLPVMAMSAMNTWLFGLSVAAAGMFARSFIEESKLHPWLRRALPLAAGWAVLASGLHATFPFVLRPVQSELYYWAYVPVLVVFLWVLVDALRRGSRAARYQAIGWAPMIGVGLIRLVSGLVPALASDDAMMLFYTGCVIEVLATTLGVADRFMAIKDERDRAQTEAQVLERLSERDPLTGLLNRRALQDRFAMLRAEGYTTLAVIDLDHFKRVNDTHGHAIGDRVLKAVAKVLAQDADTLAFRMGGEEFLLLLRGRDAVQRAENRRRALSARIAEEVDGLEALVTASMGLVEVPASAMPNAGLHELYQRADQLLYEAKQAGRNRTLSERLKTFVPRRAERRKAAA
uniref:sensor domain-containing diguanylate cyclase n=1 Tax=Altererythrobacter segetis TaxID=1104773 RepID=UPI001A9C80C9|nr:diguanylate cyclase [Altererythrobacter segetis]